MSKRALIEKLAGAGVTDEPCPLWRGWPGACSRWENDGNDHLLIFSPRAGGVFRRPRELTPLDLTDARKAVVSSEIYFANLSGAVPDLDALVEKAGEERPDHRGRINLLLLAIAGAEDPEGGGLKLGRYRLEPSWRDDEADGESCEFDLSLLAATACLREEELQRAIDDAKHNKLIEVYFVERETGDEIVAKLLKPGRAAAERVRRNRLKAMRPTLEAALEASCVRLVVDANILCEFKMPDQIPWAEVFPNAEEILLHVPMSVAEQMDAHKSARGYLRKRGIWFNGLQRRFEENGYQAIALAVGPPKIRFEIGSVFRRSELDADVFDLDDSDGRIVAEASAYAALYPDAIFMADDAKPLRIARGAGLLARRPAPDWRRDEPPDERDEEIARLRRTVGAAPALKIEAAEAMLAQGVFAFEKSPDGAAPKALTDAIEEYFLATSHRETREETARKHHVDTSQFAIALGDVVTSRELNEYNATYDAFEERVRGHAEGIGKFLSQTAHLTPIGIRLLNTGDAVAEDLLFEVELLGPFCFWSEALEELLERYIPAPPDPPTPRGVILTPDVMRQVGRGHYRAPTEFYETTDRDHEDNVSKLTFQCDRFRHRQEFAFRSVIQPMSEAREGAVRVTARAGNLVDDATLTIPIRTLDKPAEFSVKYLMRRASLWPERMRPAFVEAVRSTLGAAGEGDAP